MGHSVLAVSKPTGASCYTFETAWDDPSCGSGRYTWTDANGEVIAIGGFGNYSLWITCAGTGATSYCSPPSSACADGLFVGASCMRSTTCGF
jgi:hypothetical protein